MAFDGDAMILASVSASGGVAVAESCGTSVAKAATSSCVASVATDTAIEDADSS